MQELRHLKLVLLQYQFAKHLYNICGKFTPKVNDCEVSSSGIVSNFGLSTVRAKIRFDKPRLVLPTFNRENTTETEIATPISRNISLKFHQM